MACSQDKLQEDSADTNLLHRSCQALLQHWLGATCSLLPLDYGLLLSASLDLVLRLLGGPSAPPFPSPSLLHNFLADAVTRRRSDSTHLLQILCEATLALELRFP